MCIRDRFKIQSQILDVKPCNPNVNGKYGKINGKILSFYVSLKRLYNQFRSGWVMAECEMIYSIAFFSEAIFSSTSLRAL